MAPSGLYKKTKPNYSCASSSTLSSSLTSTPGSWEGFGGGRGAPRRGTGKVRGDAKKCCAHFLVIKRVFLDRIKSSLSKEQRFPWGPGSSRPPEPDPAPAHVQGAGSLASWKFRNFWKCEDFKPYVHVSSRKRGRNLYLWSIPLRESLKCYQLSCLHPNFVYSFGF